MKTMKRTVMFLAIALTAGVALAAPYVVMPDGRRFEGSAIRVTASGDIDLTTPQGIRAFAKGQYAVAVADEPAEYNQALAAEKAQQYLQAETLLNDIIAKYRGLTWDVEASKALCRVLLAKGDATAAVATYEKLFVLSPDEKANSETQSAYRNALLAAKPPPSGESGLQEVAASGAVECLKWFVPNAESVWEEIIESSKCLSLQSRMQEPKSELEELREMFEDPHAELEKLKARRMHLLWLTMALWLGGFVIFINGMRRLIFNPKRKSASIMPFLICCIFVTYAVVIGHNIRIVEIFGELMENENTNPGPTQAEELLGAFGRRYMPNAYAQYQEVREKALELEQTLKKTFPQGAASDSTGGTMFAKTNKKLAEAVAWTFRRRDELCFFLLFHQAGIFSEGELAEYDSRPIAIHLEAEAPDWPDDTPEADTALSAEDATFSAQYLPETHAGYQRLCILFDEGAKQYADLRRTALALEAPRARCELLVLNSRLEEIKEALQQYQKDISTQRLEHALGETTADNLASLDHANGVKIREYEQAMGVKAYVARVSKRLFMTLPGGAAMEMVWCPPGTFMMGSPENEEGRDDDETQHQVTLTKGFWMAKTEVTQAQWKSVMGYDPSNREGDNLPVEMNWNNCQAFCQKAGLSLPTEAEWEYACRAGSAGRFAAGFADSIQPVGQEQPNAWGLCDMHGNVWEWCADWYGKYPNVAVTNPIGADFGDRRVLRGGAGGCYASDCRSANRYSFYPNVSVDEICSGFRPVARQD